LETKKERPKERKQIFTLSDNSSSGINKVKNILTESCKDSKCDISYLAAGKYSLSLTGSDFKEIKTEMNKVLSNIEKLAKKNNSEFELKKS